MANAHRGTLHPGIPDITVSIPQHSSGDGIPCDNTIAVVPAVIQVTESITCVATRQFSCL